MVGGSGVGGGGGGGVGWWGGGRTILGQLVVFESMSMYFLA